MVKLLTHAGRCAGRYLTLAALTTTLVACGGSSGDTTDLDNEDFEIVDIGDQDFDGDDIPNSEDDDADGDGINDALSDTFVDLDGDGLDDRSGLSEEDANFETVSGEAPCGSETGTDANSANASWDDNCLIRRNNETGEGQFADSLYSVGVQRVVFCSGFGTAADDSYINFADGEYGPASEAAMQQFQASEPNPISDDGQVGAQSWAKLQAAITLLEVGTTGDGGVSLDSYGFTEGRCANIPLFYQTITANSEGIVRGGWSLVKNAPSTESIPFSIDPPFGRL